MRTLLVGTVPPPSSAFSRAFGVVAARALEEGAVVDVLSPDPRSAAHLHASLSGLRLAVHLAARARRYDALVLRLEPDLPLAKDSSPRRRALTLLALGASLALWRDVTVRLDSPIPIPGGVGGRATTWFWRAPRRIIVASEADRRELEVLHAIEPGVIEVEAVPEVLVAGGTTWHALGEEPTRQAVLGLVRTRSDFQRDTAFAQRELEAHGREERVAVFSDATMPRPNASGITRIVVEKALSFAARARGRLRA